MKRPKSFLLLAILILGSFFTQIVSAEEEWDGEEIKGMLESYYTKISEEYTYDSDITEISGYFTKNPTTENPSNIMVSVDFSKNLEELPGNFTENKIGKSTIYQLSDGPTYIGEDWMTYKSRSYGYCGEYRVSIDSYVSLTGNLDSESTYIELMDKYSREYLSSMIDGSQLCVANQEDSDEEIGADIQVRIVDIVGEVEIKSKGSEFYVVATIGDLLGVGDRIATGFESEAVIEVNRVATMRVKEMTDFSVSQIFYDGSLARTAINLQMGSVNSSVKPEKGIKASFNIVTPTATIGVRGTELSVSYDEAGDHTYVYVFEGSVDVSNADESKTEIVGEGYYAYISSDGDIEVTSMEEDYFSDEEDDSYYGLLANVIIIAVIVVSVVIVVAVIVIVTVVIVRKKRKKRKKEEGKEKEKEVSI